MQRQQKIDDKLRIEKERKKEYPVSITTMILLLYNNKFKIKNAFILKNKQ